MTTPANAPRATWVVDAGSTPGWLAWLLAGAAAVGWVRQRRLALGLHGLALPVVVLVGQAACTVERLTPDGGACALMLGWAGLTLVLALASLRMVRGHGLHEEGDTTADRAGVAAGGWVALIGVAVVLLALRNAERSLTV